MASAVKNSVDKVKNGLDPYLQNNSICPLLDVIEKKIHVGRAFIVLGTFLEFFFIY